METEKSTLTPFPQRQTLQAFTLADRGWFQKLLLTHRAQDQPLAAYSFPYHYIWRDLFAYEWVEMEGHCCLFATNSDGTFLALPPVGPDPCGPVISRVFALMAERNRLPGVSRIENVPASYAERCRTLGYRILPKTGEYVYRRADLVALKGERYKSQRASYNHCLKYAAPALRPYQVADISDCIRLFQQWQQGVGDRNHNGFARALAGDTASAHQVALRHAGALGMVGCVAEVGGRIAAYTLGYPLNDVVFCILLEIADREIPGLSQYIFREFCRSLSGFEFINAMDDSGLEGLRQAKLAYRPIEIVKSYIVTMPNHANGGT